MDKTIECLQDLEKYCSDLNMHKQAQHLSIAIAEITRLQGIVDKPMAYGPMAFEFYSFSTWVNKAQTWFPAHGLTGKTCVCLDAKGRICRNGRDFMQARDENAFSVTVHPYRPAANQKENGE